MKTKGQQPQVAKLELLAFVLTFGEVPERLNGPVCKTVKGLAGVYSQAGRDGCKYCSWASLARRRSITYVGYYRVRPGRGNERGLAVQESAWIEQWRRDWGLCHRAEDTAK